MVVMLVSMHEIADSIVEDTGSDVEDFDAVPMNARGMTINAGYMFRADVDMEETAVPLIVTAAGRYRMISRERFTTSRFAGRRDYQLLYVASGSAMFYRDGVPRRMPAGTCVVYRPGEPQHYEYRAADHTDVYWAHFSGSDAARLADIAPDGVADAGVSVEYGMLFGRMIGELQFRRAGYEELAALDLRRVVALMRRHDAEMSGDDARRMPAVVRDAVSYLHDHAAERFSVADYASLHGLSVSRFIHVFREVTGLSPKRYQTEIRMNEARMLLESTDYPVAEIADMVGYDNPLYFSRLFHRHVGMSPSTYRHAG